MATPASDARSTAAARRGACLAAAAIAGLLWLPATAAATATVRAEATAAGAVMRHAASAAASQTPRTLKITLKWTPKETPEIAPLDLTGGLHSLQVLPIVDSREKKDQIGENPEKPAIITTGSDVAGFVHGVLVSELKNLGIELTEADTGGARVLKGELLQFWVRDAGSYTATVRVKFTLLDGSREVWAALVQGAGENWGRSLKEINVTETLSDALGKLVVSLLQVPEFRAALKKSA